jgi:phospholipid-translocating ATPase
LQLQIFTNSPVSPATSLVPLLFVVLTTSIKQGYEDWLRHKSDLTVNNKLILKVNEKGVQATQSASVRIGDILQVNDEQEIPCDLVLLGSSCSSGTCSVTTANLDGETNLKKKVSVPLTRPLTSVAEMAQINGYIECEEPNTDLYDFTGLISIKFSNSIATVFVFIFPFRVCSERPFCLWRFN